MKTPNPRHYRWHDDFILNAFKCVSTIFEFERKSPSKLEPDAPLSDQEKRQSARLMRINHSGEICAQALYLGQSLTTRNPHLREAFKTAAKEESDHLHWCEERLNELGSHKSYLNPLWFTGSLLIGICAGIAGDKWSLGFLAETEQQVYHHLGNHLKKLPSQDIKSRLIVSQMQQDEAKHAAMAVDQGGAPLPYSIKRGMSFISKLMTTVAYYV